jgi:hypothetical protein
VIALVADLLHRIGNEATDLHIAVDGATWAISSFR